MKLALFLVVSVLLVRLLPMFGSAESLALMAGFSPLIALMLCGGAYFEGRAKFLPLAGFLISDLILNAFYHFKMGGGANGLGQAFLGWHTWIAFAVYGVVWLGGATLSDQPPPGRVQALFAGTALGAGAFYVVTNTGSFFAEPAYEKNLAGWIQCLTTGIPGVFPPTWAFLAKSLAGNLVLTILLVAVFDWKSQPARLKEGAAAPTA